MYMDNIDEVPFRAGQLVESKSFQEGYRGAWFRCKIRKIKRREGIMFLADFFDYPDDKAKWTKVYEKNKYTSVVSKSPKEGKMELMFRPSFPCVYRESEMFPQATCDTVVLIRDAWKVGDMVDWFCDSCYWSGVVTKILGEDKVQIDLLQCPMGEGGTYEASSKDLRPYLDWTPEHGWVVPLSNDSESCVSCAHIVQPCKEVKGKTDEYSLLEKLTLTLLPKESFLDKSAAPVPPSGGEEKTNQLLEVGQGCEFFQFSSPEVDDSELIARSRDGRKADINSSSEASSSQGEPKHIQRGRLKRRNPCCKDASLEMNTSHCQCPTSVILDDSVESSIVKLEELALKVRWLRGLLKFGFEWSNNLKPSWKVTPGLRENK